MNFWLRNGIFALILSILAGFLLVNHELLMTISDDFTLEIDSPEEAQTAEPAKEETIDKEVIEPPQQSKKSLTKSKNSAAEGLSRFYANLHGTDDDEDGPKIRNGVVFLPEPKGDLEKVLEAKAMVTRPLRKNWKGSVENRPFRKDQTLLQKMIEYAAQDGLDVMWRLNRDLIVKNPFRINKDILQTAYQIGNGIRGHFPEDVIVYFCYKQRTIVFNHGPSKFLAKECNILTSKSQYSSSRSY
ncbi:hypothetical protein HII17_11825 [Thalassotalea sp. M1531]|uniref:Toxin co-regulated pilus biosynthesis protein Q C-terminal domain-containing protein n=1 Tax=Thalassotalea algicola TaxID=2716224 RepID=A0A7Y0LDL7_9GAMM|nr:TcpQ domain-containing protein [Thalassotalea algicola]NMP32258.1 hypothetical protein [Thalassotalea algicola]